MKKIGGRERSTRKVLPLLSLAYPPCFSLLVLCRCVPLCIPSCPFLFSRFPSPPSQTPPPLPLLTSLSLLASSPPRRFPHPIRPPARLLTAGVGDSPEIPRDSARIRGSSRRSTANRRGSSSREVRPPLLIAKARCLVPAAWGVGLGACARRFPVAGGASRCGERMNLLENWVLPCWVGGIR